MDMDKYFLKLDLLKLAFKIEEARTGVFQERLSVHEVLKTADILESSLVESIVGSDGCRCEPLTDSPLIATPYIPGSTSSTCNDDSCDDYIEPYISCNVSYIPDTPKTSVDPISTPETVTKPKSKKSKRNKT